MVEDKNVCKHVVKADGGGVGVAGPLGSWVSPR
jgi:hypothetical protein